MGSDRGRGGSLAVTGAARSLMCAGHRGARGGALLGRLATTLGVLVGFIVGPLAADPEHEAVPLASNGSDGAESALLYITLGG